MVFVGRLVLFALVAAMSFGLSWGYGLTFLSSDRKVTKEQPEGGRPPSESPCAKTLRCVFAVRKKSLVFTPKFSEVSASPFAIYVIGVSPKTAAALISIRQQSVCGETL